MTLNLKKMTGLFFMVLIGFSAHTARSRLVPPEKKINRILSHEAPFLPPETHSAIREATLELSKKYRIDPLLIIAIMKIESSFRPHVQSNRGAIGLMQIKPIVVLDVASKLSLPSSQPRELLKNVHWNLRIGVHYLFQLLERFDGDFWKALTAYNHGPTSVAQRFKNRPAPSKGYAANVMNLYREFLAVN